MNVRLLVIGLLVLGVAAVPARTVGAESAVLPVYVEDSPAAADLMAEATRLREQDRLADAVAVYQKVIDQYGQKLLQLDERRYVDAVLLVQRELAGNEELLEAYASVFEPSARRMLDEALGQSLPEDALRAVFERYPMTLSGRRAGLQLAGVCLERGGASDALGVLGRLESLPGAGDQALVIEGLRGVALLLLEDRDGFESLLARLRDELGRGDQAEALKAFANRMRGQSGRESTETQQLNVSVSDLSSPLWTAGLAVPETKLSPRQAQSIGSHYAMRVVPVAHEGVLYLNESESVLALDLRSGRLLWRSPNEPLEDDSEQRGAQRWSLPDPRGVLVAGDRVISVLGRSATGVTRWRQRPGMTQLVCMDRTNGSVRWTINAEDLRSNASTDSLSLRYSTPSYATGTTRIA